LKPGAPRPTRNALREQALIGWDSASTIATAFIDEAIGTDMPKAVSYAITLLLAKVPNVMPRETGEFNKSDFDSGKRKKEQTWQIPF
jgi:hypothetical protein